MRAHGVLSGFPAAGASDHVCWVYDDDAAFDAAVREFLTGGLDRCERLLCVGERVIDSLRGQLPPFGDVDARNIEGHDTHPTPVDWDADGVPDLLIGAEDGHLYYLRNPRSR